jgi:hypothetical protein
VDDGLAVLRQDGSVVEYQQQNDDDRNRHPKQPQQNSASHDFLLWKRRPPDNRLAVERFRHDGVGLGGGVFERRGELLACGESDRSRQPDSRLEA